MKCEKYSLHKYNTFEELNQSVDEYIQFYNYDRCILDRGQFTFFVGLPEGL
ncbi:hypothetical protein COD75_07690 [Bacillus anthracis]|uniref:IS3 family transposase n=1 Tax=Bacillus cereus TaxID=1396 RepID=UPI0009B468E8|nr:IS3 family transposase [Bacillus sp. Ab-1751]PEQ66429.1 hypothetical protein CN469_10635 [Bacillus cereus]PFD11956.1 hypothetical protein CN295_12585 [Bacillus cereus]PGV38788.1 hypothetical protein COD75_07690 [Bacillus anthracis]PGV74529.1 hypothetical protein COD84_20125 [Bacillus cereus]